MFGRFAVIGCLGLLGIVAMPESAAATVWMPLSPTPADLNNLDQFEFYSWRIDFASNGTASGEQTDSATPLYNGDLDASQLFLRLANTSTYSGVQTLTDGNTEPTESAEKINESSGLPAEYPSFNLTNLVLTTRFFVRSSSNGPTLVESPGWSVAADSEDDDLHPIGSAEQQVFTYTYTFTPAQAGLAETPIGELQEPVLEGDVTLLLDPDFNSFNDKITLKIRSRRRLESIPEPAGLLLVGLGLLAGAKGLQLKRAKKGDRPELA